LHETAGRGETAVPLTDRWDIALLALAGLVAVTALVRLMAGRRRELAERFQTEVQAERQRQVQAGK
jgi:hypothetical protein